MAGLVGITLVSLVSVVGVMSATVSGQDAPQDSAQTVPDTTVQLDSLLTNEPHTIDDSILMLNPDVNLDTLTGPQRMLLEFETRFRFRQQEEAPKAVVHTRFSYEDSLAAYYVSPRWNLRSEIDKAFHHDAGDYLRSDPGFFILEPLVTPMRKTAQAYGLAGDRMGLLICGKPLRPFEHVVEPDGLVDLNDLPTALDYTVAALPGPVGLVFGSDRAAATLFTRPRPLDSTNPRSSFVVDKGDYSYSYARGRYAKDFTDGRHVDMSIGYRKADVLYYGIEDDAYHYTGDFLFPLGGTWEIETDGHLYARDGEYQVRPDVLGAHLDRNRFDRLGRVRLSRYNMERNARYDLVYQHVRQGSRLVGDYGANLNQTGHALELAREWQMGASVARAELFGDFLKYDNWHARYERYSGGVSLNLARTTFPWGYALALRATQVELYRVLPTAAVMLRREGESRYVMFSVGYTERAPSQNELHLPYRSARLYNGSTQDYADQGNPNLVSEKTLNGAVEVAFGHPDNSLTVSATGGKIWDGIDWFPAQVGALMVFSPENGDIEYASASAIGKIRLSDFLRFKGGGSYRQVDYARIKERAYTPDYQAFSGLELHLFWRQKLIDFWAYGEAVFVGPYNGYVETDLGERLMTNVKLSFRLGQFRFHWIMQNALSTFEGQRDYWTDLGYSLYYGFTWDFLD
ncbi:MAG: hypothetical protein AB1772_09020 [Candidatus Zixiibacteriota bacterium]